MQIGFVNLGSKTVYYGTDGKMLYGEQKINGSWYYFKPGTGAMQKNTWHDGKYYGKDGTQV